MKYERCEMCGIKKRDVHDGQCTKCHAQICDEPFEECPAKQHLWRNANFWDRFFLEGPSETRI